MRNLKRALSVALASVMLLGMMVVGTGASSYSDVADNNDYIEAIEVLKAVGVMGGDDQGKFNPDASVTRAEMAVVMTNMLGLNPNDYAGTNPFTDVPDWAANYVAACYSNDIVGGVGDNKFDPDGKITAVQAALMMQKALGYFQYASDYGANWDETMVKVTKLASQINLWKNVAGVSVNTELTRGQVAQVALNALKATTVDAELISGGIQIGDIVVNERVEYNKVTNSDKSYNAMNADKSTKDEYTVELGEKLFDCKLVYNSDADAKDAFGVPAVEWEYKDKEIGKFATVEPVLSYTADFDTDEVADLEKDGYKFTGATVTVNGETDEDLDDVAAVAAKGYKGVAIELYATGDDKKVITNIVIREGQYATVDALDEDSIDLKVGADKTTVSFTNDEKKSDEAYDKLAANYEKGDALIVYLKNDNTLLATEDVTTFDGKVATVKGTEYFTVDGDKYNFASNAMTTEVKAGSEYTFTLDANGYVIAVETIKEADASIGDVYYVDNVWTEKSQSQSDYVDSYYAQIVALDGTVSEIELEKAYTDMKGQLVTISDKKDGDSKADNGKYDLKVWENKDFTVAEDVVAKDTEFTKSATRVNGTDDTVYRLNSKTEYLFLEGSATKLETTVYTGGVNFTVKEGDKVFIITAKDSTIAQYVLVFTADAEQTTKPEFTSDLVYVKSESSEKGDGYRVQKVYGADGKEKTLNVAESFYGDEFEAGFYAYATNKDGYYELKNDDLGMKITKSFVWKDETGVIANATMGSYYKEESKLTVTVGDYKVEDIVVEGAAFVDAHDKTTGYDKSVSSLSALINLVEDGKVGAVTLSMNVAEDGAVIIVVNSIAKAPVVED